MAIKVIPHRITCAPVNTGIGSLPDEIKTTAIMQYVRPEPQEPWLGALIITFSLHVADFSRVTVEDVIKDAVLADAESRGLTLRRSDIFMTDVVVPGAFGDSIEINLGFINQ